MDLFEKFLTTPALARSPIWLQRAGFAWLLGPRMFLLEHTGRKSGQPRYTSLEVVKDERPQAIVVGSGFGRKAQWYRNLEADPTCYVTHMFRRRIPARAELIDAETSAAMLSEYTRAHPQAWERLEEVIRKATGHEHVEVPMVRLHLE